MKRFVLDVGAVRDFYESDVAIEAFDGGFVGRWHTRVHPDVPGIEDSDHFVGHLLRLGPKHHVLDFGSGVGVTTCGLARRSGATFRGLNVSPKQVAVAKANAADAGLADRVSFDVYPGEKFPYRPASFDRATFFESPCHVPHKPLLFRELLRVLRPGGACAGQDWVLTTDAIAPRDYADFILPIEQSCQVSLVSLDGYRRLMEEAGFVNVRALDGRELDPRLFRGFARPSRRPVRIAPSTDLATRLRKAAVALANAFYRGLFTIGFFYGDKPGGPRRHARPTRVVSAPRRLAPADERPEMFAPDKNVAWLDRHREAFAVPESEPLARFRALVERSQACTIRTSCRVEDGAARGSRFDLVYHGAHQAHFFQRAALFFDEVERAVRIRLDGAPLRRFIGRGIDFAGVRNVVTGLDLHPDEPRSRLELSLKLSDAPDLARRAIALHGDTPTLRALRLHDELLVGFDLRFDGTTDVRLYPDVRPEHLRSRATRARLGRVLSPRTLDAMGECLFSHVCVGAHDTDAVVQLHPADPDAFVARWLPGARAKRLGRAYEGRRLLDMAVSMHEGELARRAVKTFALSWTPADAP